MQLHAYARARAAFTKAEEDLIVAKVAEERWPRYLVRRIVAELLRPPSAEEGAQPPPEDSAAVDSRAGALWRALEAGERPELSGVRFLLAPGGCLLLENAARAHGSPEAALPSCVTCGDLTEDVLCEPCVDLHRPAVSPEELAHRERVRAFLASGVGESAGPAWSFLLTVVASRLPALAPLLSRVTPLRLHRSGYFCATIDSDEDCQALMRGAREVELLLVEHGVPALGYRMGRGWDPTTWETVPLSSCEVLHLP